MALAGCQLEEGTSKFIGDDTDTDSRSFDLMYSVRADRASGASLQNAELNESGSYYVYLTSNDAALGVVNTSQWNKDLDNAANVAFVETFQAEFGRLPSLYASQGFDTANLLISALEKADVSDADAFRAALKAADFESTRGDFKFGNNHHPIQTIYAREVVKEGDVYTNKLIGPALENHADAYAADCKM